MPDPGVCHSVLRGLEIKKSFHRITESWTTGSHDRMVNDLMINVQVASVVCIDDSRLSHRHMGLNSLNHN